MNPHHHVRVNKQMRADLKVWEQFLRKPDMYCRPFVDFHTVITADQLFWYTDASGKLGYGGICGTSWFAGEWGCEFLETCHPSIEFQELFAVTASVLMFGHRYADRQICLFCDNQSVISMINHSTSSCPRCMELIRILTLESLEKNLRVFAKYVTTKANGLADSLLRGQMGHFKCLAQDIKIEVDAYQTELPQVLFPLDKYWSS